MTDILSIVMRSAIVYLAIVAFIRIFGKKELSQLSVIDLVFILLISNSVQNAMVGNSTSLQGGLVAAATLFALNAALRLLIYRFKPVENFLEGQSVMLVYEGQIIMENMKKQKITLEELNASIREHGVENISDVNLAVLEADGNISVLSDNFSKKTTRKRKHHKALSANQ
ncbi:MAG: hypothetical protein JWP12_1434 [Bacteroidetes bacterium]|nr:hypothetical protein [Bacteroidota bacterium]